jgi:phage protein D
MSSEALLSAGAVYRARPLVEIEGRQDPMVQTLLLGLEVLESEGGLSSLELRLANTATREGEGIDLAFEYDDMDLLSLGKRIKVFAGDEEDPQEIFRGVISGLEFAMAAGTQPELIALAEDGLQKGRMARRTRLHAAGSVRDLVERIATEIGLRPVVTGLGAALDPQMQLNESSLAFLRRVLGRFDADLQVVGEELHASPRGEVRRGQAVLEMNRQLQQVRAVTDLAHQATAVTFAGWSVANGRAITARSGAGADLGPGSGRTGATVLEDAFGERVEHLTTAAVADAAEAQALVDAEYARAARRFVRVSGVAEGNPAIRVGAHVELRGLGPRFDNTYYVIQAAHRFDQAMGYKTHFQAESAYFGG